MTTSNGHGGRRVGAGRKTGVPSQKTVEVQRYARGIVEDAQVRAIMLEQAQTGVLPAPVMQMLFYYAFGKPTERIEHSGEVALTLTDRARQANDRIARLRRGSQGSE